MRLSWPYNPRIVFNELIHINFTHFLCYFLIKIFIKFIVQYWIRHDRMRIKFYNLLFIKLS